MSTTPVSFVEQATDFRLFRVGLERNYRHSRFAGVADIALPILRAIGATVLVPVAALAGTIWHTGKAIRYLPGAIRGSVESRRNLYEYAKIVHTDRQYSQAIVIASSLTIFGFMVAIPFIATKKISQSITGRPFVPNFENFLRKCISFKLIDLELETIERNRRIRNVIPDAPEAVYDALNMVIEANRAELGNHYGVQTRNALAFLINNLALTTPNEIGTWAISTTRNDLANRPERVIDEIAEGSYSRSPQIMGLTVRFGNERAFDAGGPSREFISQLFSSLADRALKKKSEVYTFIEESGASLPACHADSKETKYRFATQDKIDTFTNAELKECLLLAFGGVIPDNYQQKGRINAQKVRDAYEAIRVNIAPLTVKERAGYEVMGALLSHSQRRLNFPIGQIFSPVFFDILALFTKNDLSVPFTALTHLTLIRLFQKRQKESAVFQKAYELLHKRPDQLKAAEAWKEELFYYVYSDGDFPDFLMTEGKPDLVKLETNFQLFQEAVREKLYREALADKTLPAIHAIAQGMAKGYKDREWQDVMRLSGEQLSRQIQGELRKEVVASKVVSEDQRIKSYMRQWIQNANQKQLVNLVKAATGSTTIGQNQVLLLQPVENVENLCVFHTCTGQIDIPRYANYDIFKQKLDDSIDHALVSGFTLA